MASRGIPAQLGDIRLKGGQLTQLKEFLRSIEAKQEDLKKTLATKRELAGAARRLSSNSTTPQQQAQFKQYANTIELLESEIDETNLLIQQIRKVVLTKQEIALELMVGDGCPVATTPAGKAKKDDEEEDLQELDDFDLDLPEDDAAMEATSGGDFAPPESDMLLSAAMRNDVGDICYLVEKIGVNPSYANKMNQSAVHIAALWGNVEALEQLLEYKPDVNKQNFMSGATPIHSLVGMNKGTVQGRLDCLDLLLKHGADPNLEDLAGNKAADYCDPTNPNDRRFLDKLQPQPPLFAAIDIGDITGVRQLLVSGNKGQQQKLSYKEFSPVLKQQVSYVGFTPSIYTILKLVQVTEQSKDANLVNSWVEILELILERTDRATLLIELGGGEQSDDGDNNNIKGKTSSSTATDIPPLVMVCEALLTLLEDNGNENDIQALERVCTMLLPYSSEHRTAQQKLLRLFHGVCRKNDVSAAHVFLNVLQMDPNTPDRERNDMTALHFAARSGCTTMVRYLIQQRATGDNERARLDTAATDRNGKTALDYAKINQKLDVVKVLEEHMETVSNDPGDGTAVLQAANE